MHEGTTSRIDKKEGPEGLTLRQDSDVDSDDYKKWIIEMIDTEQKIIGPTSLKDQSRAENLN